MVVRSVSQCDALQNIAPRREEHHILGSGNERLAIAASDGLCVCTHSKLSALAASLIQVVLA